MSFAFVSRQLKASLASVAALMTLLSGHTDVAHAAGPWPARVHASYDIDFNGLNVGTFDFSSTNDGQTYSLTGNGKLSLLLGAFKWNGETRTTGKLHGETTKPQSFAFGFQGSSKSGSTRMSFSDDTVTSVLHEPPSPPKPGTIPVLPQHLKGVLDPLTAMMAISGASLNPCSRRIPIYDGKSRFDLVLTPRGMVDLREQRPSGQPGQGHVCRVKYVPIAGHKIDDENKFLAQTDGIELVLRPIPSANVFVPYRVTIPTGAGPATLTSRRVDIVTSQHQQIALIH